MRLSLKIFVFFLLNVLSLPIYASFIESTVGAAVVNDATATYYNPAALVVLKKTQLISLNSFANFHSQFTGQAIQTKTGFVQSGSPTTNTHYFLPSFYFALPMSKVAMGVAVISNFFDRDIEGNSALRYVQSDNSIQSIDVVPAVGIKLNDYFSVGASVNFSHADFLLMPITGFPSLNIPDSQSRNESDGNSVGGDLGLLIKPNNSTTIGLNYRSAMTYRLKGKSVFESNPPVVSDNYGFTFWTPARTVLSINQFLTPTLGVIGTIQRIDWSIFKEINIEGIAIRIGTKPFILSGTVPYHFQDTWLLTLGGYYQMTPKWVVRIASSYNQSPGDSGYQIVNGNSVILGASTGYELTKHIVVDGSYAHAFMQNKDIFVVNNNNMIFGVNGGSTNSVSLKLTLKL